MFCPSYEIEDHSSNRFCRSCGVALQAVCSALDQSITTLPLLPARQEIGRAVAPKIGDFETY